MEQDEAPAPEETGPVCGERLRKARREQEITLSDISKELHLDEAKVRSIEENDFAKLGAPVFAKGHLKKYAQLVQIDPDDVLADYYQLTRTDGLPPVVSDRERPDLSAPAGPMIAVVVAVIAVIALASWWFFGRDAGAPAAPMEPDEQRIVPDDAIGEEAALPEVVPAPAVEDMADDEAASATDSVSATTEAAVEPAVAQEQPAADSLALVIEFSGDCWTEITDSNGDRLFFDLGREGRRVAVEGSAPISVLLGNAAFATLSVNGASYTIPDDSRRGETARFTLYP